jgi:hypothetical protein
VRGWEGEEVEGVGVESEEKISRKGAEALRKYFTQRRGGRRGGEGLHNVRIIGSGKLARALRHRWGHWSPYFFGGYWSKLKNSRKSSFRTRFGIGSVEPAIQPHKFSALPTLPSQSQVVQVRDKRGRLPPNRNAADAGA